MIRLILLALVAVGAFAQRTQQIELFGSSGTTVIRMNGATGRITLLSGATIRTSGGTTIIDENGHGTFVNLAASGTLTGIVGTSGNQTITGVKTFSTVGGIEAAGGITVSGTSAIDVSRNGNFAALTASGNINTTAGGFQTNGTTRITSTGNGSFVNLSFSGTGPYGLFTSSPITGSISTNVISLACGTCVSTSTLGALANSLLPATDNAIDIGSTSKRWAMGKFAALNIGVGNLQFTDGLLQMTHTTSGIRTVVIANDIGVGTGASFQFSKAAGTTKFKLDAADSDAPDSINGYKVNGTSAMDGTRNANINNLTMSGTLSGFPTSTSATCGAGEAVKSVSISSSGAISVTCAVP